MKSMTKLMLPAIATAGLFAATAQANIQITEIYFGLNGEDGTVDWFEVTNLGAGSIDTGDYLWDDSNPVFANAVSLPSFILGPGESAVILGDTEAVDDATYANALDEFTAIWGSIANVGYASGPGLGQGGDSVNLFDSGGTLVESLGFGSFSGNDLFTLDDSDGDGTATPSVLGVNGAYASNAFFNDNLGLPNNQAVLIGSPGVVPEPATMLLAGLGGLALLSRRG